MRGKRVLIGGIAVLVAILGGALMLSRRLPRQAKRAPAPVPRAAAVGAEVSLSGKVRAQTVVAVAAPVDGTVQEWQVESGQRVFEGQVIGRVENTGLETEQQQATTDAARAQERVDQLQNELIAVRLEVSRAGADANRAKAEFDRAEKNYLRQQMLNKEGATPRTAYEKAAAEYQVERTSWDTLAHVARGAEERLSSTVGKLDAARKTLEEKNAVLDQARESAAAAEIRSPADGVVVALARKAGEEVTTELTDLVQIAVNLSALEATVEPEPPVLARVRPGQEAMIQIAELPYAIPGRVKEIQGAQVVVEFTSPDPSLLPGATAQVRIKLT